MFSSSLAVELVGGASLLGKASHSQDRGGGAPLRRGAVANPRSGDVCARRSAACRSQVLAQAARPRAEGSQWVPGRRGRRYPSIW